MPSRGIDAVYGSLPIYRLTLTRAMRFAIEKWKLSIAVYLSYLPSKYHLSINKFLIKSCLILSKHIVVLGII